MMFPIRFTHSKDDFGHTFLVNVQTLRNGQWGRRFFGVEVRVGPGVFKVLAMWRLVKPITVWKQEVA